MSLVILKNNLVRFSLVLALVLGFAGISASSISAEGQVCVRVPGVYGSTDNCTPVERTSITSSDVVALSIASFSFGIVALGAANAFKLAETQIFAASK